MARGVHPFFRPMFQYKRGSLYAPRRLAMWVRSLTATSAQLARRWLTAPLSRPVSSPASSGIPSSLLQSACRHLCVKNEQELKVSKMLGWYSYSLSITGTIWV